MKGIKLLRLDSAATLIIGLILLWAHTLYIWYATTRSPEYIDKPINVYIDKPVEVPVIEIGPPIPASIYKRLRGQRRWCERMIRNTGYIK